jgi:hypothetical protein
MEPYMESVEIHRKVCLRQQTELRRLMTSPGKFDEAIRLFMVQHAMLHSERVAQTGSWSFEDEVLNDISESQMRKIPSGCDHSIAWLIWHLARCEDITMNILVAGRPQVLVQGDWNHQLKISVVDTGNAMDKAELTDFSNCVSIEMLRSYRSAVGGRTREIVAQLQPNDLKRKVDSIRIQAVINQGAVLEEARGIVNYWSKRDVAGLLLMPATRHNLVHLTEAFKLRRMIERMK